MRNRGLICIVIVAALLPAASADAEHDIGALTAASLRLQGDADIGGDLRAASVLGLASAWAGSLRVEVDRGRLELDHERGIVAAGGTITNPEAVDPDATGTTTRVLSGAIIEAAADDPAQEANELFILADAPSRIDVRLASNDIRVPTETQIEPTRFVRGDGRVAEQVSTHGTMSVTGSDTVAFTIEAPFHLVFWAWTLDLQEGAQGQRVRTGVTWSSALPATVDPPSGGGEPLAGSYEAVQAYLFVYQGRIHVEGLPGDVLAAYLESAFVSLQGQATLYGAVGQVGEDRLYDVRGADVRFGAEELELSVGAPLQGRLPVIVRGDNVNGWIGAQPLGSLAAADQPWPGSWPWVLAGGLAGALGVGVPMQRRLGHAWLARLEEACLLRERQRARRLARLARLYPSLRQDASEMLARLDGPRSTGREDARRRRGVAASEGYQ
jgi:hypothetical protein